MTFLKSELQVTIDFELLAVGITFKLRGEQTSTIVLQNVILFNIPHHVGMVLANNKQSCRCPRIEFRKNTTTLTT